MSGNADHRIIEVPISLDNLTKLIPTSEPKVKYVVNTVAVAIAFLAVLFLLCLCANCLLLASIASSNSLRKVPLYVIVVNLAIVNIVASVSHIVPSMYLVSLDGDWSYFGPTTVHICTLHAFLIQLITVESSLCVVHLCSDRLVSITRPTEYRKYVNVKRQIFVAVSTWTTSLAIALPVAIQPANLVHNVIYPRRYSCFLSSKSHTFYCLFLIILFMVIPITVIAISVIYITFRIVGDGRKFQSMKMNSSFSEFLLKQPHFWNELQMAKLVPALALLFTLLYVPFLAIQQYTIFAFIDEQEPLQQVKFDNATMTTNNASISAIDTSLSDTVFTWMYFLYYFVAPVLVIYLQKDIRRKLYQYFLFWKNNSVSDGGAMQPAYSIPDITTKPSVLLKPKHDTFQTSSSIKTPVLFATSEGLHLRTVDNSSEIRNRETNLDLDSSIQSNWSVKPKYVSNLCDVRYFDNEDIYVYCDRNTTTEMKPLLVPSQPTTSLPKKLKGIRYAEPKNSMSRVKHAKKSVRFADEVVEIESSYLPDDNRHARMAKSLLNDRKFGSPSSHTSNSGKNDFHKLLTGSNSQHKIKASINQLSSKQKTSFHVIDGVKSSS